MFLLTLSVCSIVSMLTPRRINIIWNSVHQAVTLNSWGLPFSRFLCSFWSPFPGQMLAPYALHEQFQLNLPNVLFFRSGALLPFESLMSNWFIPPLWQCVSFFLWIHIFAGRRPSHLFYKRSFCPSGSNFLVKSLLHLTPWSFYHQKG